MFSPPPPPATPPASAIPKLFRVPSVGGVLQLPSYLRNNPALLERYRRWLQSSSSPMTPPEERSGDNRVVAADGNLGADAGPMIGGGAVASGAASSPQTAVSAPFPGVADGRRSDEQQQQHPSSSQPALSSDEERRRRDNDEKRLSRDLPLVWTFLREKVGWAFADNHSWDVCGPAGTAGVGGGGSGERRAGPMPQGRVSRWRHALPWLVGG